MAVLIGIGGEYAPGSLPLATRRGTRIPNQIRAERPPDALRTAVELWRRERPNAELRSATAVYDCTGLVFASRRTTLGTDFVRTILKDDEYQRLPGPEEVRQGDIVIYGRKPGYEDISHVGIVIARPPEVRRDSWAIVVMSQWGGDGEYIHPIDHVPSAYGEPREYWTDRRSKP